MREVKIDIVSGFLGAGKTTFIKKYLEELKDEKVVLIENEFGEIGIDSSFLKGSGIEIKEMNSGCICCSLVGDFSSSLKEMIEKFNPDRVIIEPSGVGKLSDVKKSVVNIEKELNLNSNFAITIVDVKKVKMYMRNFGEFFNDQIKHANTIILSRTDLANDKKIEESIKLIKEVNETANIISTPLSELSSKKLVSILEKDKSLLEEIYKKEELLDTYKKYLESNSTCEEHHHHHAEDCECGEHHHHHAEDCGCREHHHHHHAEDCGCGEHHHHHAEDCGCGEHHHHHAEDCGCGEHHHHHAEDCGCEGHHHHHAEDCGCGEHHHHHDGCGCGEEHHHADEVFSTWGLEFVHSIEKEKLEKILDDLANTTEYGIILRAKGILKDKNTKEWIHFDLVPEELEIRIGDAEESSKLCVIGINLNVEKLEKIFRE